MKCFVCEKDILAGEPTRVIPLDKPYVNLRAHRPGCIQSMGDEKTYILEHIEKLERFLDEEEKNKPTKRK